MRPLSLLALTAPLLPTLHALTFTSPTVGQTLSRGATYDITWTSVDTDPSTFSIYLWNFANYPPFYTFLGSVETASGSKEVTIPCDVAAGGGWQFSAIAGSNVYVIDAQSQRFNIDDTVCSSPTVGANPEGCPAAATAATVTVTVTECGASSSSSSLAASVSAAITGPAFSSSIVPSIVSATATISLAAPAHSEIPVASSFSAVLPALPGTPASGSSSSAALLHPLPAQSSQVPDGPRSNLPADPVISFSASANVDGPRSNDPLVPASSSSFVAANPAKSVSPSNGDPSSSDPSSSDPSSSDPSSSDPSSGDPSSGDPSSGDPSSGDPSSSDPNNSQTVDSAASSHATVNVGATITITVTPSGSALPTITITPPPAPPGTVTITVTDSPSDVTPSGLPHTVSAGNGDPTRTIYKRKTVTLYRTTATVTSTKRAVQTVTKCAEGHRGGPMGYSGKDQQHGRHAFEHGKMEKHDGHGHARKPGQYN